MLSTKNITIESVHGLKETVVISRDGIRPAASQSGPAKNGPGEERRSTDSAEQR